MNNFFYKAVNDPLNVWVPSSVQGTVGDWLWPWWTGIISTSSQVIAVKADKITAIGAPHHRGIAQNGNVSGDTQLAKLCWDFKLNPANWRQKTGYKHISGVPTSDLLHAQATSTALIALNQFAAAMEHTFTFGAAVLSPCIYTRPNVSFPSGRTTLLANAAYSGLSQQRSRSGRANVALLAAFAI